jgi:hypothetical protein
MNWIDRRIGTHVLYEELIRVVYYFCDLGQLQILGRNIASLAVPGTLCLHF